MKMDDMLKDLLEKASLYGLLAKKYEYVDPQKHMYYYQKHFQYVMKVEQHYMMLEGRSHAPKRMPKRCGCNKVPQMMPEGYNNAPYMMGEGHDNNAPYMMPQSHDNNAPHMMPQSHDNNAPHMMPGQYPMY
ncbi:hypothetical protein RG959_15470 [Domibacillus sp. 8LH]|uniref:hypothetical protein n=1 Tax=Domibacillus sp. 8LH TaxID=3073900 RepID=UPI00318084A2